MIKASDPLQSKEGIELGLSDPWVCTSSAPHAFKGASEEIFQMSSDAVGLYDFGHSGTWLLVAAVKDGAEGALTPRVRPEQK